MSRKKTYKRRTEEEKRRLMRAAGVVPLEPFHSKDTPWRSRCVRCRKTVSPRFNSVVRGQGACKYCAGVATDGRDRQKIMKDSGFKPLVGYPGVHKPWKSKCLKCGKISTPRYGNVVQGSRCRACAVGSRTAKSRYSIDEVREILKKRGLKLTSTHYNDSKSPVDARCLKCRRMVKVQLQSVLRGSGCAFCAGKRVDKQELDLKLRLIGLKPIEPYRHSSHKWRCRCLRCKKLVTPTWSAIRSGQGGCAYCAGKKVDPDDALATMVAANLVPLEKFRGSNVPWRSRCGICSRIVVPRYSNVKNGHGGCLSCAGKLVDPRKAVSTARKAGLQPLVQYPGSHKPWKCKCIACGRVVTPTYGSICRGGGCRFCADIGIDYTKPGYLYLLTHPIMNVHKIGIANHERRRRYNDRIRQHMGFGWKLVNKKDFKLTDEAFQIEQKILRWWRQDLNLSAPLQAADMPQGGFTETVSADDISTRRIWSKVNQLSRNLLN